MEMGNENQNLQILGIALIIVRNPKTGQFLAVHQKNHTWWVPGGRVDAPQSFTVAAARECLQQAGIHVQVKGILRFQHSQSYKFLRIKMVFYGEPKDPEQVPKKIADKQSLEAKYMSIEEIKKVKDKWRGPELYDWATYIQKGGVIYPLDHLYQKQLI